MIDILIFDLKHYRINDFDKHINYTILNLMSDDVTINKFVCLLATHINNT